MAKFRLNIETPELKEIMFSRRQTTKVYRLKRKTFGVAEAAQNTLGGVVNTAQNVVGGTLQTAGNLADNKMAGLAGAALGANIMASAGNPGTLGTIGGYVGKALGVGSGPLGMLIGAGLGAMATRAVGKGLKSIGESVKAD